MNAAAFGSLEHPLDLLVQDLRLADSLPCSASVEQFLVGHRAPEEIRQPAGQGEVVELAGPFARETGTRARPARPSARRARPARTCGPRPSFVSTSATNGCDVVVGHRPPKGAAGEAGQNSLGVGQRIVGDDLHALAVVVDRGRRSAAGRRRCGDGSPAARRRAAGLRLRPTRPPGPARRTSRRRSCSTAWAEARP